MLTILFSCTARRPFPELDQTVDRTLFSKVFRENNYMLRRSFFSDPLIKHMWSKIFIKESPEVCIAHLRRIRSKSGEEGELKFEKFREDLFLMEADFNFKMLPNIARNEINTQKFSQQEQLIDFEANIHRNKRHSRTLRDNLNNVITTMNQP